MIMMNHFFGENGLEKLQSWLKKNLDNCPVVGE